MEPVTICAFITYFTTFKYVLIKLIIMVDINQSILVFCVHLPTLMRVAIILQPVPISSVLPFPSPKSPDSSLPQPGRPHWAVKRVRSSPHFGGSNWWKSKSFHVVLPYTSWRVTFPSSFHQLTSRSIIPILSPFFVPGGSWSAAPGGGSAANVTSVKCSSKEEWPGSELP